LLVETDSFVGGAESPRRLPSRCWPNGKIASRT
jgi:hypothetical protein